MASQTITQQKELYLMQRSQLPQNRERSRQMPEAIP
jgi:hypothetical protein